MSSKEKVPLLRPTLSDMDKNPLKTVLILKDSNSAEEEHYDVLINEINNTAEFLGEKCLTKWDLSTGKLLTQRKHQDSSNWHSIRFHKKLTNGVVVSRHFPVIETPSMVSDQRKDRDHTILIDSSLLEKEEDNSRDDDYISFFKDGHFLKKERGHRSECWDLVEMEDGTFLTGSHDESIKIWDAERLERIKTIKLPGSTVHCLKKISSFKLISTDYSGRIVIWKYPEMTKLAEDQSYKGFIWGCDIYENWIVIGGNMGEVFLYNHKLELLKTWVAHRSSVRTCCFLRNGYLCTGGYDDMLRVWSVETLECVHEMHHTSLKPRFVRLMSNGWIVVGGWSNEIDIYDTTMYYGRIHFYNNFGDMDLISDVNFNF